MFIIAGFIVIIILIVYQKSQIAICKSTKKLHGRTVIVTGGTSGIGFEIAKDLARRGAKVIIACPCDVEGYTALAKIAKATSNHNVYFKNLNLASLTSVRDFAARILEKETRLDILVNNAGVGSPGDFLTGDGMHFVMQVNYYGHFLLTLLLLPLMNQSGTDSEPSRVINMSSYARQHGSLDVDDYNKIGFWNRLRIYASSKLCLVLLSRELAKRLSDSNVVINCADPGMTATGIYYSFNAYIAPLIIAYAYIFYRTPWQGAQTAIQLALDDKAGRVSGKVFENCELTDTRISGDLDLAASKLWEQSVRLVKLEDQELLSLKHFNNM